MGVIAVHGVATWEGIVGACFVPVRCSSPERAFRGRLEHFEFDDVSVSAIRTGGLRIEHTAAQAASAEREFVRVSMQIGSTGSIRQGGRCVNVRPGAVTIYRTARPYLLDYSAPSQRQLVVQIPTERVERGWAADSEAPVQLAPFNEDASRLLFRYCSTVRRLRAESLSPDEVDTVIDLASTALRGSTAGNPVPRTSRGLLFAIDDFIMRNLRTVAVDDVAGAFFMSRRGLYLLFEKFESTPGDYLRQCRLKVAARQLASGNRRLSVNEIAESTGFRDSTTFSRAFRREFGATPRAWRSGHRTATAAVGEVAGSY